MSRYLPLALAIALAPVARADEGANKTVDYKSQVVPILSKNCYSCHGANEEARKANLRLDKIDEPDEKFKVVVPGKPDKSELILRLADERPEKRMPPVKAHDTLTGDEINLLRNWVKQGAGDWEEERAYLAKQLLFDLYLVAAMVLVVLVAGALAWPPRHKPNQKLPYLAVALLCVGAVAVPASWPYFLGWWAGLGNTVQADILTIVHFSITAVVVGLQFLILLGGVLGWRWVRNFWLRLFHLLAILVVAGQGVNAVVCPFTSWEAALRGGRLDNLGDANPVAAWCNRRQYTEFAPEHQADGARMFAIGYVVFGLIVVASWFLVRPIVPGSDTEEEKPKPPQHGGAEAAPVAANGADGANRPQAPNLRVFPD